MKQHIYILILIISLLSISSKTYSQVDIAVRNINRGIELCDEGKHHIGLFYLSIGLRNEELPDSLRNIGELYRQCSYIITDKEKVSNDILENVKTYKALEKFNSEVKKEMELIDGTN